MIGHQVGNYRIISLLGQGGMGEVYLAEHVTIGTRVAIKVLQAQISKDLEQVDRFFNEAKAVSKIRHSGPVKIFDCGFVDHAGQRVAYLAMEYLEGESLAARIRRLGTLPGEQIADIGRQIAGVLDAVHTAGITHRDLKPDNIYLVPDHELPSGERVKVLDFGIAKLTGTLAGPQTKGTMGTPAYMAPEQWNNSAAVDGRADLYSLGCVVYEMAVGRPPFPAHSIGEACNHHLNTPPPRASATMSAIPPEFDTLVDRMLAKTVDRRPTLREIAQAFDTLRTSGATQRWQAARISGISGVAETLAPGTPLGTQPQLSAGSQPAIPYGTPQLPHAAPYTPPAHPPLVAAHYAAQPSAPYPIQPTQPVMPTPQHAPYAPGYAPNTPYDPTPPPPAAYAPARSSGGKGLLIGVGAVALIGGGIAIAMVAGGGGGDPPAGPALVEAPAPSTPDRPAPEPPAPPPRVAGASSGAAAATPPADAAVPAASKRDQLLATNPFVDRAGVRVLSSQITAAQYELVLGSLPVGVERPTDPAAPVGSLTQDEAAKFCAAIDARLPTSAEWERAAKGAWGIAVGPVAGPLQEWTSTLQDELVVVRGGHAGMSQAQLDRAARHTPPYFLQKEPAGDTFARVVVSSKTIGFRCVDGTTAPAATAKVGGDAARKTLDRIDKILDNDLGSIGGGGTTSNRPPPATGDGRLAPDAIQRTIRRYTGAIRACYQRELDRQPGLEGKVTVTFVIGVTGEVTSASATGMAPPVADCIARIIKRIRFPAPEGGIVKVSFPFVFKAAG